MRNVSPPQMPAVRQFTRQFLADNAAAPDDQNLHIMTLYKIT
jgi:hypothetical protein